MVEVQKFDVFFWGFKLEFFFLGGARMNSAGIGVVEVQRLEVFCDSCGVRATLCGDRRGRGANCLFLFFCFFFFCVLAVSG